MTAAKLQASAAMLYMCCMHGRPVCQLVQPVQVAGNTEQASKAIAAFATAVQATQLLVSRLDDDKATTNSIVRYVWHDFVITAVASVCLSHSWTQQCAVVWNHICQCMQISLLLQMHGKHSVVIGLWYMHGKHFVVIGLWYKATLMVASIHLQVLLRLRPYPARGHRLLRNGKHA